MQNKRFFTTLLVIGASILTACSDNKNETEEIHVDSLKSALNYLATSKNYTFKYLGPNESTFSMIFTDKSIGTINDAYNSVTSCYIEDNNGVYHLTYDEKLQGGEYLADETGTRYTSLWDKKLTPSLLDEGTSFIKSIKEDATEVNITDRGYKTAFIKTIGYTDTDYVNLESLNAKYEEGNVSFTFKFSRDKSAKTYVACDFGTSRNEMVENYLSNGGSALELSKELFDFRYLMRRNNFIRQIYSFTTESYVGIEVFHSHYFYTESTGTGTGSGAISLAQKANTEHSADLKGCYSFTSTGSYEEGIKTISLFPQPYSEDPDIVKFYHYPTYLKMLTNMEFIHKGDLANLTDESIEGTHYYIKNKTYLYDFVSNFSIDQSFDTATYVPYALSIYTNIQKADKDSTITFVYHFTYGGTTYSMPIPFYNFGSTRISRLDSVYQQYND